MSFVFHIMQEWPNLTHFTLRTITFAQYLFKQTTLIINNVLYMIKHADLFERNNEFAVNFCSDLDLF